MVQPIGLTGVNMYDSYMAAGIDIGPSVAARITKTRVAGLSQDSASA